MHISSTHSCRFLDRQGRFRWHHSRPGVDPHSFAYLALHSALHFYQQDLEVEGYRAHPAAVDAATHLGAVADTGSGQPPKVPVSLGCFAVPEACLVSFYDTRAWK